MKQTLNNLLEGSISKNEMEEITKIASSTISEITHYTTVSIGPSSDVQTIENIRFVLLSPRMMMAVILTDNGQIKETVIKYDEDITQNQVDGLNNIFNNRLRGKPLEKIDKPMEEYILSAMILKPSFSVFIGHLC